MILSALIPIRIFTICHLLAIFHLNIYGQQKEKINSWPQFRGINAAGIAASGCKPPVAFDKEENLLWEVKLPEGHSSPVIWQDHLVVTGCIEDNNELQVICLDRTSGSIKWRKSIFADTLDGYHAIGNPAQQSAAIDSDGIYVYVGSYGLVCYSINGEKKWKKRLPRSMHRWGTATSPMIADDLLIVNRDNQQDGRYLMAVNKRDGELIWKTELQDYMAIDPTSWSTPIVWKDQIILHRFGGIDIFSLSDGTQLSNYRMITTGVSTPVVSDDMIYVGTWHNLSEEANRGELPKYIEYETLLADFDINNDSIISKKELPNDLYVQIRPEIVELPQSKGSFRGFAGWMDTDKDKNVSKAEWDEFVKFGETWYVDAGLIAFKPRNDQVLDETDIVWRQPEKIPEVPSPLLYEGRIYMIKDGGTLTCMDSQDGSILYRERIGVSGPYFASPVAANGYIYISANKGEIAVIKAGDELKILTINDIGERIYATPAIVDNHIYVRTEHHLYAFGNNISF